MLAKALARESGAAFVSLDAMAAVNSWALTRTEGVSGNEVVQRDCIPAALVHPQVGKKNDSKRKLDEC